MPTRYIEIPEPVTLKDPVSKAVLTTDGQPEVWDFKQIINKIMSNPKWGETYAAMRAQAAIEDALADAKDGVMVVAEEDWTKLKDAAENPRTQVITTMGAQVISGFGVHPTLVRQLIPLIAPIVDAKTERPRKV